MSIASRITSIEGHISDIYDSVELTGVDTTDIDKNLVNVPNTLKEGYIDIINNGTDTLYNNFPKVSGEGTSLTLNNTYQAPMRNNLKGNTSQTGTPTPTNPIPVNVVSGDNEINICGKNLLNIQGIVKGRLDNGVIGYASNTTDLTLNDNSFSFTTNANYRGVTTDYIIRKTGTYTIIRGTTSGATIYPIVAYYDENLNFIVDKQTFTQDYGWRCENNSSNITNAKYIRIYFSLNTAGTSTLTNPQVEYGDQATDFEPYQGNTYNIDLPVENLFDKDNANTIECLVNGTNGAMVYFNGTKSLYIPIQSSKTYTISKILSARFVVGTCVSTPANGVTCSVYRANNTGTSITITSGASDKYLCVFYYLSGTDTLTEQQILDSIQIEVGSKANTFTPFGTTPIELCKIGNYQDYFYKDSDKWYLHKEIGKVVYIGNNNEGWTGPNSVTTPTNRTTVAGGYSFIKYSSNNYLSNYFIKDSATSNRIVFTSSGVSSVVYMSLEDSITGIASGDSDATKLQKIKTWLSTHNTTVYYILATPTNTEITDTTLINQLEELYIAKSKENQTNISQINNDLGFIISASALKKG